MPAARKANQAARPGKSGRTKKTRAKRRPKHHRLHFREPPRSIWQRLALLLTRLILSAIALSILLVLPLRWVNPVTSSYMLQARWLEGVGVTQQWRDSETIAWPMKMAVIAAEDQRFPEHYGFDVQAIRQAIEDSHSGNGLRGASTITQQVARNLYLWPGESSLSRWSRKGLEAWFTGWLEMLLSKQRILEIYLNIAELGPGIYGVEAASRHYFSSTAGQLNQPQAAALAALLPSPKTYSLFQPSARQRERREWIQQQIRQLGEAGFLQQHNL